VRRFPTIAVLIALMLAGCSRAKEYRLDGQVLAVDPAQQVITVKHQDIQSFMPGMTMPFRVRDAGELTGRNPGDLITATLVVEDNVGYLKDLRNTGEAPLPAEPREHSRVPMIEPGTAVHDAELTEQDGRTRHISDWRGKTIAVTFVYTRCPLPDFCPLMDRHFKAAQTALRADPVFASRVHLLSVSFDPDYDTPAVISAHATRVGADPAFWSYLTGTRGAVDSFAGAFGVSVMRENEPTREIIHNLRTAVIDTDGRLVTVLNGRDWTPEQLVDRMRAADARR
jgi:protein SCO1/2